MFPKTYDYTHGEMIDLTYNIFETHLKNEIKGIVNKSILGQEAEYQPKLDRIILKGRNLRKWSIVDEGRGTYTPIPDLAVGPTITVHNWKKGFFRKEIEKIWKEILANKKIEEFRKKARFLSENDALGGRSYEVSSILSSNRSPMCCISFEFEKRDTAKYILGSLINASLCGKIGFFVYPDENQKIIEKIFRYIDDYNKTQRAHLALNTIILSETNYLRALSIFDEKINPTNK